MCSPRKPEVVDGIIAECVRIKAEVVSADEREGSLRMILNFGHTAGHALEAETGYSRFLHGEAVAFGMRAAVYLAERTGHLAAEDAAEILRAIRLYGPIPPLDGVSADAIARRALVRQEDPEGTSSLGAAREDRRGPGGFGHRRRGRGFVHSGSASMSGPSVQGTTPPGASGEAGGRALGPRHVRPRRAPLRPAESPALAEYRPLLARADRRAGCGPFSSGPARG